MYIRTTLASDTLNRINRIWGAFNEFEGAIPSFVRFAGRDEESYNVLTTQDRKEHLERCLAAVCEETVALSQLYPTDSVSGSATQTIESARGAQRLLETFDLHDSNWEPGGRGYDALQDSSANLSTAIYNMVSVIGLQIQSATPLAGQQAQLITPELVSKYPQAALQQVFTLFEHRLRERIGAGPGLFGEALINRAFADNGRLMYGATPAERNGVRSLMSGAYATFRNPRMHRILADDERIVMNIISLVDLLIWLVDQAEDVAP